MATHAEAHRFLEKAKGFFEKLGTVRTETHGRTCEVLKKASPEPIVFHDNPPGIHRIFHMLNPEARTSNACPCYEVTEIKW